MGSYVSVKEMLTIETILAISLSSMRPRFNNIILHLNEIEIGNAAVN